jgi:exodeoxyribonuclease VII large subunit
MCPRNPFFEAAKARPPRREADVVSTPPAASGSPPGRDADAPAGAAPLTVSALVGRIKDALSEAFPRRVAVVGEISNFKRHSSGHLYFSLKDPNAAISAVMFRAQAAKLKFAPEDGMEVVADGRVDLYDVRGQLQLYVERLTPKGAGALEVAFRQLREKLSREGLFDAAAKKPLPAFARAVGLVTSPTGAAVRDIRRTLRRRWPAARVYLVPALVQGDRAAEAIAEGIRLLDAAAERLEIDTLIVARGGGSLEDLWAFNEEAVARAIFAARTPVISGVGHEVDVTIADLAADVRAATPTAAAELAVPDAADVARHLGALAERLTRSAGEHLRGGRSALASVLRSVVFRDPAWRVRTQSQRADELSHRLAAGLRGALSSARQRVEPAAGRLAALHPLRLVERARWRVEKQAQRMRWALGARSKSAGDALQALAARAAAVHPRHGLGLARQRVSAAWRQLEAMSYRSVLGRGFSVTRRAGGAILRAAGEAHAGERIETELREGKLLSRVEDTAEATPPRPPSRPRKHRRDAQPTLFND